MSSKGSMDENTSNKRKDAPAVEGSLAVEGSSKPAARQSANDNNSNKSPYEQRRGEILALRKKRAEESGQDWVAYFVSDALDSLYENDLGRFKEIAGGSRELSSEERTEALNKLTQDEVNKFVQCIIVPNKTWNLKEDLYQEIMFADARNSPGDGMVMLNTHSTWCMYPVINKQISQANREINASVKRIQAAGGAVTPGAANQALNVALATIEAVHGMDHWRLDTESEEDTEKIAKKVLKLAKDLLWFQDVELGFDADDSVSRQGLLFRLKTIAHDWMGGASKLLVTKNGNGLGRSSAPASAPVAKKAKVAHVQAAGAGVTAITGLTDYLQAMSDETLEKRVKTVVQFKIVDLENPGRTTLAVVSGATSMKKMSQLVAYLTKKTSDFHYHSQKGRYLKGSRIELTLGDKKTWLAEKNALKRATAAGATLSIDNNVKIVQVIQGLTMGTNTGIVWDGEEAKTFANTPGAVVWVAPDESRYEIKVQAIVPKKSDMSRMLLPRVVTHDDIERNERPTTGFGLPLISTNNFLLNGRQLPPMIVSRFTSQAELQNLYNKFMSQPLCKDDGTGCCANAGDMAGHYWQKAFVDAAGPPVPAK